MRPKCWQAWSIHRYGFSDRGDRAFIQAIRENRKPNADVLEGHLSALLIHYANISYRLGGEKVEIDAESGERR